MSKIVYSYHSVTHDYIGSSPADLSPLEPGVYLVPAFATPMAPPKFNPHMEIPRFDVVAKKWTVINIELLVLERRVCEAKDKRNELLKSVIDRLNPAYWESVPKAKREEWKKFRQDLIDVDKQTGFPHEIAWPVQPEL